MELGTMRINILMSGTGQRLRGWLIVDPNEANDNAPMRGCPGPLSAAHPGP